MALFNVDSETPPILFVWGKSKFLGLAEVKLEVHEPLKFDPVQWTSKIAKIATKNDYSALITKNGELYT